MAGRRFAGVTALTGSLIFGAGTSAALAADALEDPLRPAKQAQPTAPTPVSVDTGDWQLESTLISSGRRVAIINGRAVRAGDAIAGARVLRVEPGAAHLRHDGRRFTIRRPETQVRSSR
jgi:MSHA biogenesis protein MshK